MGAAAPFGMAGSRVRCSCATSTSTCMARVEPKRRRARCSSSCSDPSDAAECPKNGHDHEGEAPAHGGAEATRYGQRGAAAAVQNDFVCAHESRCGVRVSEGAHARQHVASRPHSAAHTLSCCAVVLLCCRGKRKSPTVALGAETTRAGNDGVGVPPGTAASSAAAARCWWWQRCRSWPRQWPRKRRWQGSRKRRPGSLFSASFGKQQSGAGSDC
jgi:hypothetical protein